MNEKIISFWVEVWIRMHKSYKSIDINLFYEYFKCFTTFIHDIGETIKLFLYAKDSPINLFSGHV